LRGSFGTPLPSPSRVKAAAGRGGGVEVYATFAALVIRAGFCVAVS